MQGVDVLMGVSDREVGVQAVQQFMHTVPDVLLEQSLSNHGVILHIGQVQPTTVVDASGMQSISPVDGDTGTKVGGDLVDSLLDTFAELNSIHAAHINLTGID